MTATTSPHKEHSDSTATQEAPADQEYSLYYQQAIVESWERKKTLFAQLLQQQEDIDATIRETEKKRKRQELMLQNLELAQKSRGVLNTIFTLGGNRRTANATLDSYGVKPDGLDTSIFDLRAGIEQTRREYDNLNTSKHNLLYEREQLGTLQDIQEELNAAKKTLTDDMGELHTATKTPETAQRLDGLQVKRNMALGVLGAGISIASGLAIKGAASAPVALMATTALSPLGLGAFAGVAALGLTAGLGGGAASLIMTAYRSKTSGATFGEVAKEVFSRQAFKRAAIAGTFGAMTGGLFGAAQESGLLGRAAEIASEKLSGIKELITSANAESAVTVDFTTPEKSPVLQASLASDAPDTLALQESAPAVAAPEPIAEPTSDETASTETPRELTVIAEIFPTEDEISNLSKLPAEEAKSFIENKLNQLYDSVSKDDFDSLTPQQQADFTHKYNAMESMHEDQATRLIAEVSQTPPAEAVQQTSNVPSTTEPEANATAQVEENSPPTPALQEYEVQKGDSLWNIVKEQYGLTNDADILKMVDHVADINGMSGLEPNNIHPNDIIKLPTEVAPSGELTQNWKDLSADTMANTPAPAPAPAIAAVIEPQQVQANDNTFQIPCDAVKSGSWTPEKLEEALSADTSARQRLSIIKDIYVNAGNPEPFLGNGVTDCGQGHQQQPRPSA